MYITAYFSNEWTPADWLSPSVTIKDVTTNAVVASWTMTWIWVWLYKYNFTWYTIDKEYIIYADWWATLSDADRYQVWNNITETPIAESVNAVIPTTLDNYTNKDNWKADVSNIPINPLLDNDIRLNHLDADISSRSTFDNTIDTVEANNMRGTDNANTIAPDNTSILEIKSKVNTLENFDSTNIDNKLILLERLTKSSVKIVWTELIMYDELWELQKWDLQDENNSPNNENVYFRIKK